MENENVLDQQPGGTRRGSLILFLLLGALVALGVFFAVIRPFNIPQPAANAPAVTEQKAYSSTAEGFSLQYPAGWNQLSEGELTKYNGAFALAVERSEPHAFLSVKKQTIDAKNVQFEALARSIDNQISKNFTDAKKIGHNVIRLNDGRQALRYEYSFMSAGDIRVREQLVIILAGSKVYHLSASAGEQDFESVRAELDSIAQSMEVK